ncbi:FprA family A-type flavoprotein [SCandidatus Aminicenantes bacterium Aminicenantia_JdfR_composite]|jgi:flavorubredoxin|nr:FprA family A-type flavoprotein [SCandidatus Aminicenantes bacterium Aminicenantia_JdfR_composite]MCP2596244.1 FprA family A-type flavoprotein [Candidatus Aminicenantes bacterium AC-335-G13]MCP2597819.1 FprA family A-type flavoprotein [Candidatus Aminicenantes bacterium AC-335-L06]MCP2606151.1 FprA family A-type flavoprotein [Candidatus Aminicenantes bacterium AC-708-I09]
MTVQKIKDNVYFVGAIHWDRRLFDELIPLPDGTTYNSYLIKGSKKTALIDAADPAKENELLSNLRNLGVKKLDYLISNHAEQDHSGVISRIVELYPETKIVTNEKCKDFLRELLLIPEDKFYIIKDGDELSLGNKTLKFIFTPWVHWPETMVTYLIEDRILFSCDFFGSHYATSSIFAKEGEKLLEDAKRYYAEIMMPFRKTIVKNIEKISVLDIDIIAPSHGPLYKNPSFIINAYKEWISDDVKNEVLIPYVSMHGSTERMVEYFIDLLVNKGIEVKPFNLSKTDIGELAMALVDAATIVIASPMVLAGAHPAAVYAAFLVNALRPKTRFLSIIGSYGWGGKFVEQLKSLLSNLNAEFIEPVIVKGYPKEKDFKALENLADKILEKHKQLKIV